MAGVLTSASTHLVVTFVIVGMDTLRRITAQFVDHVSIP